MIQYMFLFPFGVFEETTFVLFLCIFSEFVYIFFPFLFFFFSVTNKNI